MKLLDAEDQRVFRRLCDYFYGDELDRFTIERLVGKGAYGIAWKIKYRPSGDVDDPESEADPETRRIILKASQTPTLLDADSVIAKKTVDEFGEEAAEGSPYGVLNEQKYLKILRYAKHIVGIIEPPNEPLSRLWPGLIRRLTSEEYIFLENIENGELGAFLSRCAHGGLTRLPNRVLWRLFMCLIRFCIGFAWPPEEPDGSTDAVLEHARPGPPSLLKHGDLHDGNVMIGSLINDPDEPEHDLVPILKVIDFGTMEEVQGVAGLQPQALTDNIFSIGKLMAELATLNPRTYWQINSYGSQTAKLRLRPDGADIETLGTDLLPEPEPGAEEKFPDLDRCLRNLICTCLAQNPSERPRLQALANTVVLAIEQRDEAFYAVRGDTSGLESDESIREIVQKYIFDADGDII